MPNGNRPMDPMLVLSPVSLLAPMVQEGRIFLLELLAEEVQTVYIFPQTKVRPGQRLIMDCQRALIFMLLQLAQMGSKGQIFLLELLAMVYIFPRTMGQIGRQSIPECRPILLLMLYLLAVRIFLQELGEGYGFPRTMEQAGQQPILA